MRSVLLIHPSTDKRYLELNVGYQETPPPLGLVIMGNVLRCKFPDLQVRILDGNYLSVGEIKEITQEEHFDLIGLSDWFTNHENCLEIARHAKSANARSILVLGGPNAGHLANQILSNHSFIDYVVANDGEDAITGLVAALPNKQIPNLYFRGNGSIEFSHPANSDLNALPQIDFDFKDLAQSLIPYDSRRQNYEPEYLTPFPVSLVRGCIKAVKSGRCAYCSIPGDRVKVTRPEKFWDQISFLNSKYGIEYFFETGDDFSVGSYPERVMAAKPKDLNVRFRIYTQPVNISERNLKIFQQIGVREIFIGVENVNYDILERSNKPYDTSHLDEMLELLSAYNIRAHLAFLFGLPGETQETVQRNFDEAIRIVERYEHTIKRILFSLAVPIVGCDWFVRLQSDLHIQQQYKALTCRSLWGSDTPDYSALTRLFVRKYCSIDYEWLLDVIERGERIIGNKLGLSRLTTFGNINRLNVISPIPNFHSRSLQNPPNKMDVGTAAP